MPQLELRNISKKFSERTILTNINLTIEPGESIAISGDNGCGKTTLLRIITGLSAPTSGNVELSCAKSALGVLIQPMHIIPHFTVNELLKFYAELRGGDNDAAMLTEKFGLQNYRNMPCMLLSRGYRQRLALTLTLAFRPKLLVMDEPIESLDEGATATLTELLQQQLSRGTSLILVAHQRDWRQAITKTAYNMSDGKLVRQ